MLANATRASEPLVNLFDEGTPADLACRGFGQAEILARTGFDAGYHTNGLRGVTKGIDRLAYKRQHMLERVTSNIVEEALAAYAAGGSDAEGVLSALGLANPSVCKLRDLFSGTPFEAAFKQSDKAHRYVRMTSGFAERHGGVDNPFKLDEYQEMAADTREKRYGGRYMLSSGSAKADAARATFADHMADDEFRTDLQQRKSETCRANYGVDHPAQSEDVRAKMRQTTWERYGEESWARTDEGRQVLREVALLTAASRAEKARATCRERYGVDNWAQTDEARKVQSERMRESLDERFAKMHETMLARYGVEWGGQTEAHHDAMHELWAEHGDEIVDKIQATRVANTRAKYLAEHAGKRVVGRTTKDFIREARMVHGTRYDYSQAKYVSVNDKVCIVCPEHGEFYQLPMHHLRGSGCPKCAGVVRKTTDEFVTDAIKVHGDKYSYDKAVYVSAYSPVVITCPDHGDFQQTPHSHLRGSGRPACWRDKARQTSLAKYGVAHPMQHPDVQAKARATNLERLGVMFPGQSAVSRDKMRKTMLERYGVDNGMKDSSVRRRVWQTKSDNGTFNTSAAEIAVYDLLCDYFGEDDVCREYDIDARYPYHCDFYIKSRDMFIELNGMWTHGAHWYDAESAFDADRISYWRAHGGDMLESALHTWCESDVMKRKSAADAKLNYVVFWDGSENIMDARLWFAMGCPDGHDWEREYSWLPKRELSLATTSPKLTGTSSNVVKVSRWANGEVFYGRELAMWRENAYQKVWGTLQARLYANRYKYLKSGAGGSGLYEGKLPDELSDLEIVRGFGIMGKVRAYSTFDNTAMVDVIKRYGATSVLDPCAGWGERLATCCWLGLPYLGIDVNELLFVGYERIVDEYGDTSRQRVVCVDAAEVRVDGDFDAVITCPPYGSLEHYSDVGAENLDENEFAAWWKRVVVNVTQHVNRLFCVQTNQACKDVFVDGLETYGWCLVESVELSRRSSHMTRRRGGVDLKREFEEMLVFERAR